MDSSKMPSKEFTRALELASCGGGSQATCELCGRYHFASEAGYDFVDGELARLEAQAREKPDQFIDHLAVSVSWAYISGRQAIVGCPCGEARKWEKLIVDHRDLITRYLPLRLKRIEGEREIELKSEREMVARLDESAEPATPADPKKSISAIEWPNEAGTGYNVGEFDVTSIVPFSRGEEDWLEVREGDFVCCQVPAYQVAIFYEKPDKVAPADSQSGDE